MSERCEIRPGDCLVLMAEMPEASVDAIVTDPPYGLSFMGREWDHGVPGVPFWTEALRIAKPGAHLVAFGGTRTYHRLTCAIEDAGWEIRDVLMWLYGSGFPKSLDVSKAMDKAAGAEREVTRPGQRKVGLPGLMDTKDSSLRERREDAVTGAARQWDGWGTALKPAWEPIILARKPLIGTVAANVLEHGTGALNVDGCRIGAGEGGARDGEASAERRYTERGGTNYAMKPGPRGGDASGRWPANLVLDEGAAALLDEQSGERRSSGDYPSEASPRGIFGARPQGALYADAGGASRFFYTAKASSGERHYAGKNTHPTVKPVDLMQWLCRLVTPPGGLVLDPFMGSGSTGIAALGEGFRFLGLELNADYCAMSRRRIAGPLFADAPESDS